MTSRVLEAPPGVEAMMSSAASWLLMMPFLRFVIAPWDREERMPWSIMRLSHLFADELCTRF